VLFLHFLAQNVLILCSSNNLQNRQSNILDRYLDSRYFYNIIIISFVFLKGGSIGADNIASKIIEFSKNIRELNAELGKEKTKSQSYKRQLEFLEHQQVYI